jgi:tetratricopeptide (TPR) repeat protein
MNDDVLSALRDLHSRSLSEEQTARALLGLTLQVTPPDVADAVRMCAIPAWFNARLLALLSDKDEGEAVALLEQIAAFYFVMPCDEGGYVYDRSTRARLLDWWREPKCRQRFAALNDRLAQYYLALVRELSPRLSSPDYLDALIILEAEHPNIDVSHAWAVDKGDWELARDFAYILADYSRRRGLTDDWIDWTKVGLEACERLGDAEGSARMQSGLGVAYRNLPEGDRADNLKKAIACYHEALRFYTFETRPFDYAMIQYNLGNTYADLPTEDQAMDLERAIACYCEALRVYTPEATPVQYEMIAFSLGNAYRRLATGDRVDDLKSASRRKVNCNPTLSSSLVTLRLPVALKNML